MRTRQADDLEEMYRRRLGLRMPHDRLAGWLWPLAVTALAALLRLWDLDRVRTLIFDETYYVKGAYTLLRRGVDMAWPDGINPQFEAGHVDTFLPEGDFVVHPPIGKWVIALGEWLLGADNPWGWRISVAILGTISVLMLARITRRLLGSTLLGTVAGLLLAIDGLHLVHSRTSLLDLILMFFVLAAFGALLIDRDRFRAGLARHKAQARASGRKLSSLGYAAGWRPWRLLAGVLLGLSCGVKWSGIYFLAVFGVMTVLWDWWARRAMREKRWFENGLFRDAIPAFFAMVGGAFITYLASWSGWFASSAGYARHWAQNSGHSTGFGPLDALISLWHYHVQAYDFSVNLHSPHPYASSPFGWTLQLRPTNFYWETYDYGEAGCRVARCVSQVDSVGNPLIWWLGSIALVVCLIAGLIWRDGRALACLSGIVAGWLPWFLFADRTIFTFYAVVFEPWVILALVYSAGLLLGSSTSPGASKERRLAVGLFLGALLTLTVLVSAFFWPLWSGDMIPYRLWEWHMWLPGW
nr:phospholipid carrier-dependent glycosyltransferase [Devriesea agamarum]